MNKKIKPVIVKWTDSVGTSGWTDHKKENMDCLTVGILHKEHKDSVVIALNHSAHGRGDYMQIPKIAIKSIEPLKVCKRKKGKGGGKRK